MNMSMVNISETIKNLSEKRNFTKKTWQIFLST